MEQEKKSIINQLNSINEETRERVEEFVKDVLGEEFNVFNYSNTHFNVGLEKNGEMVFGSDWDVYINQDMFDLQYKVSYNIGASGSFSGGMMEKKYLAFARFISLAKDCWLEGMLIHNAIERGELMEQIRNFKA